MGGRQSTLMSCWLTCLLHLYMRRPLHLGIVEVNLIIPACSECYLRWRAWNTHMSHAVFLQGHMLCYSCISTCPLRQKQSSCCNQILKELKSPVQKCMFFGSPSGSLGPMTEHHVVSHWKEIDLFNWSRKGPIVSLQPKCINSYTFS